MPEPEGLWLVRHGETEWSASGRHTSRTDVPLTAAGGQEARGLSAALDAQRFELVLSSPAPAGTAHGGAGRFPARNRPGPGGVGLWGPGRAHDRPNKGALPGLDHLVRPWPGGERPADVEARADRVVRRVLTLADGARALVFAHGHILRVLAARWLGLAGTEGRLLVLGTATVSELGWEHGQPTVQRWNMPTATIAVSSL